MDELLNELEESLSPEELERFNRYITNMPTPGTTLARLIANAPSDAVSRSEDVHMTMALAAGDFATILPKFTTESELLLVLAAFIAAIYWYGYQKGRASNLMFRVAEE